MKKLLRSKYKEIRRSIVDKEDRNNIIFNRVINNTKVIDADTLLLYVSNKEEVDTINIIKYFIDKKKIGVPRIDNGIMNFYYINSLDELMEGYFGILEPTSNNKIEDLTVLCSKNHMNKKEEETIEKHKDRIKHIKKIGSSIKACYIASGLGEISYRMSQGTKEWDTCAFQIIVEEAGGLVLKPDKTPITYNRVDVYNREGYIIINRIENFLF